MRLLRSLPLVAALLAPTLLRAQADHGAAAIAETIEGLGTTGRVLIVGAHPDDEDTRLVAWLARGRHVETAYLSLTRGDGGQNIIGNELGEALGVIRTEELLAARRLDGGRQFFTRAYDFGFSKSAEETYRHWPHDTILGDVVRVVRAFRPHVIITIFSGTPQDGHGHHQVSGLLGREAYDVAADTARFPAREYGAAWTPLKFYRTRSYWRNEGATFRFDSGEYDPVLGLSYAELASRSRALHRSQAQGSLEPRGPMIGSLRREGSRVNEGTPAELERGLFDGIDTSLTRLRAQLPCPAARAAVDSLPAALAAVRDAFAFAAPERVVAPLARVARLADAAGRSGACGAPGADAERALATLGARAVDAMLEAAGVFVEAVAPRATLAAGDSVAVVVTVRNRGRTPVRAWPDGDRADRLPSRDDLASRPAGAARLVAPDSALEYRVVERWDGPGATIDRPWWLAKPRAGDTYDADVSIYRDVAGTIADEAALAVGHPVAVALEVGGLPVVVTRPIERRWVDKVLGERREALAVVPALSVTLEDEIEYVPAGQPVDRLLRVHVRSADSAARTAVVRLRLPAGLAADSATRTVTLAGHDARAIATFHVRGRLREGRHQIAASVESAGRTYAEGYREIAYEHIRTRRIYRPAAIDLHAVPVNVPRALRVAYVPGASDNVAPMLAQLGVATTVLPADSVATADLAPFTTIVLGPRVYEATPALLAANPRLFDWTRRGGTLVVQYQQDIAQPGRAPYPVTLAQRAERVTEEDAPVTILDPRARLLIAPNAITTADFGGWVQERATYMPSTFDAAYTPLLAMRDPDMAQPNRAGILVAPLGRGTYVLTTLAFFRQLPAGNPGAARLFVNLLAAGERESGLRAARNGRRSRQ